MKLLYNFQEHYLLSCVSLYIMVILLLIDWLKHYFALLMLKSDHLTLVHTLIKDLIDHNCL